MRRLSTGSPLLLLLLLLSSCGDELSPGPDASDASSGDADSSGDASSGDADSSDDADVEGALDAEVDHDGDLGFCGDVANYRGVLEHRDPLWREGELRRLAFDFDGDRCPDGWFQVTEGALERVALDGAVVWSRRPSTEEGVNSGIAQIGDFTGDGVVDLVALGTEATGGSCGGHLMMRSHLFFVDGATGALAEPATALDDLCWSFPTATYPTRQYSAASVILADFAPGWAALEAVLFPYYATLGFVLNQGERGSWVMLQAETSAEFRHLYFPSTSAFDDDYAATNSTPCATSPWNGGGCWVDNSHLASAILLEGGNLFVVTSGRAVSYRPDLSPTGDLTWAAGGRTDHGGRNYGLLTHFELDGAEAVSLHGGCSTASMVEAMRAGDGALASAGDPLCGIHRHSALYTLAGGVDSDHLSRFYSYASAPGGHEGRLQYPFRAVFVEEPSATVWTAFNLYSGGRWTVLIADPRTPDTPVTSLDAAFLWDTRDLDGDGSSELLYSPLSVEAAPGSAESLLPPYRLVIAAFDGSTVTTLGELEGWVPAFASQPNGERRRSSEGAVHPVAVTDLENDGLLEVVLQDRGGALALARRVGDGLIIDE